MKSTKFRRKLGRFLRFAQFTFILGFAAIFEPDRFFTTYGLAFAFCLFVAFVGYEIKQSRQGREER